MTDIIPEIPEGFKYCPECKQVLPLERFRKRSKYQECIRCLDNKKQRAYRERLRADPERHEEYKEKDRQRHRNLPPGKRAAKNERLRKARQEDHERFRKYDQQKRLKARERDLEKEREKARLARRRQRQRNPEKTRERERVANMTPEAIARKNARARMYRQQNPHIIAIRNENQRARIANADGACTESDLREIYNLQDGSCLYCGCDISNSYTIDHFIPLSRNGSNSKENIALACQSCNSSKHNQYAWRWYRWNGAVPVFWDWKLL